MKENIVKKLIRRLFALKVVFLVYEFDKDIAGGLGRVINGLSRSLGKIIDLYVYHISFWNENTADYYKLGTLYSLKKGDVKELYKNKFKIVDLYLWKSKRFNIIHVFNYNDEIVEIVDFIKTQNPKSKFVFSCHYILKYEMGTRKVFPGNLLIEKYLYRNMDHFHVLNKTSENILLDCYPGIIKNTRVSVIPNGVAEKEFERTDPDFIAEIKNKPALDNKKIILCVTRWCHGKGIEFLADAIPAVAAREENVLFIIAGKKENSWEKEGVKYVKSIEEKLERLSGYVLVLGWLNNEQRNSLMELSDIWVFPSELEYFPYGILEPMIKKIPIITSKFRGAEDIITDNKECLMYPPENSTELSEKIITLLNDNNLGKSLAGNAYSRAAKEYEWNNIALRYKTMYEKCMEIKSARSISSYSNRESIKPVLPYDAILNWNLTMSCNFHCVYCNNKNLAYKPAGFFESMKIGKWLKNRKWDRDRLRYHDKQLTNKPDFDVQKMISVLDGTGKTYKVRMLGGEPFTYPRFVNLCREITRKHYIDVESNLTTGLVREFCDAIDPGRVQEIIAAFHIEELEKNKWIEQFIENYFYCKNKGFNITAIIVVYPQIIRKVIYYRDFLMGIGIKIYMHPFVGYHNGKEYPSSYTKKEKVKLNLDLESISFMRKTKGELCSAGMSSYIALPSGDVFPCYQIDRKIGNLNEGIDALERLISCPFDKCSCDPKIMDKILFERTILNRKGE